MSSSRGELPRAVRTHQGVKYFGSETDSRLNARKKDAHGLKGRWDWDVVWTP